MPERVKKTKCGGGCYEKKMREGMLRQKFEGGYDRDGKEDKMRGVRKNLRGGMPERVKKTKGVGRGVVAKKIEKGMPERVKKT